MNTIEIANKLSKLSNNHADMMIGQSLNRRHFLTWLARQNETFSSLGQALKLYSVHEKNTKIL